MEEERVRFSFSDEALAFIWETVKIVVISLAIIIPIRYYLVQPFFVKGQSMEPNFEDKDYILVDKLSYRFDSPQRGDVIIFRYPENPRDYFIKRIIGLPGETVEIRVGQIIIYNKRHPDGFVLEEGLYLPDEIRTDKGELKKLDDNEYYVLGDNRPHSSDSRVWGPLNKTFISGRAWVRLWPLDRILGIPRVEYDVIPQS